MKRLKKAVCSVTNDFCGKLCLIFLIIDMYTLVNFWNLLFEIKFSSKHYTKVFLVRSSLKLNGTQAYGRMNLKLLFSWI